MVFKLTFLRVLTKILFFNLYEPSQNFRSDFAVLWHLKKDWPLDVLLVVHVSS